MNNPKDFINSLLETLDKLVDHIRSVLTSISGCLLVTLSYLVSYFGVEVKESGLFICGAILADLFWGIVSSVKLGKFTKSKLVVKTGMKIAVYFTLFSLVVLAEKGISETSHFLISRLTSSVFIATELISICAHILIIKPNFPIIKLFSKFFIGEIASKMNLETKEVEEIFYGKKNFN